MITTIPPRHLPTICLAAILTMITCIATANPQIRVLDKSAAYAGQSIPASIETTLQYAPYGPVPFIGKMDIGMNVKRNGQWSPMKPLEFSGTMSIRALDDGLAFGVRMQSYSLEAGDFKLDIAAAAEITETGAPRGKPVFRIIDAPKAIIKDAARDNLRQILTGLNQFPTGPLRPGDNLMPHSQSQIDMLKKAGATGSSSCPYRGIVSVGSRQAALCDFQAAFTMQGQQVTMTGHNIFDLQTGAALHTEILIQSTANNSTPQIHIVYDISNPELL